MQLKTLSWLVRVTVLLSAAGVFFFVLFVRPDGAGPMAIGSFFLFAFLAVGGALTLLLLFLFRRSLGETRAIANVPTILRLAALLSGLATALLMFRFFGWLTWWVAALLTAGVLLVELTLRRVIR